MPDADRLIDALFVLAVFASVRLFVKAWFVATSPFGSIHWRLWLYAVALWLGWVMVR